MMRQNPWGVYQSKNLLFKNEPLEILNEDKLLRFFWLAKKIRDVDLQSGGNPLKNHH